MQLLPQGPGYPCVYEYAQLIAKELIDVAALTQYDCLFGAHIACCNSTRAVLLS